MMVPGVGDWRAEDMPRFDMASIVDNHAIMDEGFNFIHDARNPWPVDGKRWLGQRLFTEAHVRARFMEDSEEGKFNPDAVETYLRQVKRWKPEVSSWGGRIRSVVGSISQQATGTPWRTASPSMPLT